MATGQKGIAQQEAALAGVFNSAATIYFALFTTAPSASTDTAVEVTGGSYARTAVVANTTNFPAPTQTGSAPSQIQNALDITFVAATANRGVIAGGGIYRASSGGTLLYWFPILPSVTINSGQTWKIPATTLTVTEA